MVVMQPQCTVEGADIHSGQHLELHVTTGIATSEYLDRMVAEPFKDFTFSPSGVSIYHLGNFGTAQKKLKDLKVN
jgi:hypothetical protein